MCRVFMCAVRSCVPCVRVCVCVHMRVSLPRSEACPSFCREREGTLTREEDKDRTSADQLSGVPQGRRRESP